MFKGVAKHMRWQITCKREEEAEEGRGQETRERLALLRAKSMSVSESNFEFEKQDEIALEEMTEVCSKAPWPHRKRRVPMTLCVVRSGFENECGARSDKNTS